LPPSLAFPPLQLHLSSRVPLPCRATWLVKSVPHLHSEKGESGFQPLLKMTPRIDTQFICCGNIVRGETKQHSEEWRTQILIFTLAGPDVYQCLSPEQRIHRIFKRQCRVSGYKECALP
jgi:hypothetical protein